MRVLMASWAWGSHYFPLVPLGWAFRAGGHDVRVASAPQFAATITRSGLTAAPVGPDIDVGAVFRHHKGGTGAAVTTDRQRGAREGVRAFVEVAEAMAGGLVAYGRAFRPDLVVYEPTTFAAPLLARLLGVPAVRHLWTVDFTRRIDALEDELLGPLARRFSLDRIGALGDVTVDPCPARLQIRDDLPREHIRYVPYNGPAVVPDWLREPPRRPRVCVTWGTSLSGLGFARRSAAPAVATALARHGVEVVLTATAAQRAELPPLPAGVRVVDPVALHLLLPTCTALAQQGGGGTLMTGLTAGLPQLLVPTLPDQRLNAAQLAGTGSAVTVDGPDPDPAELAAAVHRLLHDPSLRREAERLRDDMRGLPSPHAVADRLADRVAGPARAVLQPPAPRWPHHQLATPRRPL